MLIQGKVLVIYAHYSHDGHHGYFWKELEALLKAEKRDYEFVDLYAIGYDPILRPEEARGVSERVVSQETKSFQDKISEAKQLVFIYPTWWSGTPAILKGFIDRVFASGFAFRYKNGLPVGLLKGRRAAVFSATGGPRWATRFILGDHSLKVMVNDTLRFCGMKAKGFSVGSAIKMNDSKKEALAHAAQKVFCYISGR
jgi:NAD(P)H dehydrogenase (quinone)